jgi:hypothetical protein
MHIYIRFQQVQVFTYMHMFSNIRSSNYSQQVNDFMGEIYYLHWDFSSDIKQNAVSVCVLWE